MENPGTYPARLKAYNFTEGEDAAKPSIFVQFECTKKDESTFAIGTFLNLHHENSRPVTYKQLALMGFKPESDFEDLCDGIGSGTLAEDIDYELVLEIDQWALDNNKGEKLKIKYINLPGVGGGTMKSMDKAKAKERLAAMGVDLKGGFAAVHADPATIKAPKAGVGF